MADHDPLCPWQPYAEEDMNSRWSYGCQCDLIARVRADEREHTSYRDALRERFDRVRQERDAARAEVAALTERCQKASALEAASMHRAMELDDEVTALTRWKDEATAVIEAWERVHALLGKPGFLGESKAEATWVEVRDLLDDRGELVEAKRARREAERDRDFTTAMANALMVERDAARAEVEQLRELAKTNFDLFHEAKQEQREAAADRDLARAEVRALLDIRKVIEAQSAEYSAEIDRMVGELSAIRMEHEAEVADLRDALEDVVNQACWAADAEEGHLDSMALSAYAHGMRVLAERGRITIEHEVGRRVIGRWVETDQLACDAAEAHQ